MQEQRAVACVAVDTSLLGVFPNLSFETSRSLNWPGVEVHRCHDNGRDERQVKVLETVLTRQRGQDSPRFKCRQL